MMKSIAVAIVIAAAPLASAAAVAQTTATYRCSGDPPLAFTATFSADSRSVTLERHGVRRVLKQQPTASGIAYAAKGVSYREHQGAAVIVWPGQPRPLDCTSH